MRRVLVLALVAATFATSAIATPLSDRLQAFNAALVATPCETDSECEAMARAHGLDPDILDAISDCENGDDDACEVVDDAMRAECDATNECDNDA